jgi:hypothetical protein
MRNLFITLIFVILSLSQIWAQEIIENPEKPMNKNAGRVLELKEELRITDKGGEFFFQFPNNIKVASDGSIFITDRDLLMRFDEQGTFLHNYFKKGQGPGEINYLRDYVFDDGKVIAITSSPLKFVTFLFDGELVDDVTRHEPFWFYNFQFLKDGRFFFFINDRPETGDEPGVFDAPHLLISMEMNGQNIEEHLSLPYQFFMTAGASSGLGRLISVPFEDQFLFINDTEEYLVKIYDIEAQKIVRSIKREYRRVKPPEDYRWPGIYSRDGKRMGPPPPKFLYDINALYIVGDKLWVRTSTRDKEEGYLIDVFDFDGRFVDSFYLRTGSIISTCGDAIFIRETDENELVSVVKYHIVG